MSTQPTILPMPDEISAAKRIHVVRLTPNDDWFVGYGKSQECQIEGTANHWHWLALIILGLVDQNQRPYSEDKPLPVSLPALRQHAETLRLLEEVSSILMRVRPLLPTHGSFGEDGVDRYEAVQRKVSAHLATMQKEEV